MWANTVRHTADLCGKHVGHIRHQFRYTKGLRRNNFDALRLLLALGVFFSHSYPISGSTTLYHISVWSNSVIAVQCFFVISGFLIFSSYHNSVTLSAYSRKRASRICPAYILVVVFCAVGGVLFSRLHWKQYFSAEVCAYLIANLSLLNYLHPTLPEVFTSNPIPVINGALWTIKVEVLFYMSVPIIALLFKYLPKYLALGILYTAGLLFRELCYKTGHYSLAVQLPGQLPFFMSGAFLYFYEAMFLRLAKRVIGPAILGVVVEVYLGTRVLFPLSLAIVIIYVALCVPGLSRLRPQWDLSYGFYLWHFPILQAVTFWGWFNSPVVGLLASGALTGIASVISWLAVEKRFIKSGRQASQTIVQTPLT